MRSEKRVARAGGQSSDSLLLLSMNIDNLPDDLLVEILCRLACNTLVFQCKCVSKRWFNLISTPYFIGRYLRLQRDLQTPILTTLVLFDEFRSSEVYLTSKHSVFKTRSRNFILDFLPCYQDLEELKKLAKSMAWSFPIPLEPGYLVPPVVVATYKDLVLCCATTNNQRDYFICNPFTKQWAALPPTPRVYPDVRVRVPVALICDSYYFSGEEEHISTRSIIPVNAEYLWKVVRLVPTSSDRKCNFNVEIFSSETREWRELVVLRSRTFYECGQRPYSSVAYNGMLYWHRHDGFIFELDLDLSMSTSGSGDHNIAKCRFIQLPMGLTVQGHAHLFVNGGRLHFCRFVLVDDNDEDPDLPAFRVWELKQVVEHRGKFRWLADRVSLTSEDENVHLIRSKMCRSFRVVAFLQNNEDIVYLKWQPNIFTCNLRGGKLEIIEKIEYTGALNRLYPLVFPWWPTPVPRP